MSAGEPHSQPPSGPVGRPASAVPKLRQAVGGPKVGAEPWCSVHELAEAFRIPVSVLMRAQAAGQLEGRPMDSGDLRFDREALTRYLLDAARPSSRVSEQSLVRRIRSVLDARGQPAGTAWFTPEEAAAEAGWSPDFLEVVVSNGHLTVYEFGSETRVFSVDLNDLLVVSTTHSGGEALGRPTGRATPPPVANCADLGSEGIALFFSERLERVRKAQDLCSSCEIQEPCLEGALRRGEFAGVWGGQLFRAGKVVDPKRVLKSRPSKIDVADRPSPSGPVLERQVPFPT